MTVEEPRFEAVHDLAVTCTDRGQHKRIRLSTTVWWRSLEDGTESTHSSVRPSRVYLPALKDDTLSTGVTPYQWNCPMCRRNPQIKADRWRAVLDAARRTGLEEYDVSYLD